ncbi:hypothetical protein BpHYR1_002777 [Brachionus plicatilis]|uniref:Uncharacterized protein n=1 Tax=Brachionus plicatilis TaxID=10195 RepID=A0A3M7SZR2_BRAPC|nr:hypothetical protein BpHYR1_002777 [Brachionus plicatilis]
MSKFSNFSISMIFFFILKLLHQEKNVIMESNDLLDSDLTANELICLTVIRHTKLFKACSEMEPRSGLRDPIVFDSLSSNHKQLPFLRLGPQCISIIT